MVDRRSGNDQDDGRARERWLSEQLDAAADAYEPDTERLKAMVSARIAQQSEESDAATAVQTKKPRRAAGASRAGERGGSPRRRRGLGLIGRLGLAGIPAGVALSTVGAAAAIAVGATATIAVTSSHDRHTVTVAAPSTSPEIGGGTGSASASAGSGPRESASPAATGESTHSAASTTAASSGSSSSGLIGAAASVDKAGNAGWSQLDLVVTVKEQLTALHVTVKVSKCAGLASTGSFDTVGSQFTEVTSIGSDGSITYEFELVKGATLAPGTFTFAAQFQHATSGWQQQDDTYYVSARTAASTSASVAEGAY